MIIFISDLHLMDGTGGIEFLPVSSYERVFDEFGHLAREAEADEVTIVFLGDIYDLIRTERWFAYDVKERPWGEAPSEAAALDLLNGVINQNQATFDLFASNLVERFRFPVEPKRVYIPGNHDRVCDLYASLRRRVCETLAITNHDSQQPFDHQYLDVQHAVLARHGQEWDAWNFSGSAALREPQLVLVPWKDYAETPIGDLLACEVSSKLPGLIRDHLPENYPGREALYNHFRILYDVVPTPALMKWIFYQVGHNKTVDRAIDAAFKQVAREFNAIPFVAQWERRHRGMQAVELELLMGMMETINFSSIESLVPAIDSLAQKFMYSDNYASQAAEDFQRLDATPDLQGAIQFVLYGHTHKPEQRALSIIGDAPHQRERAYLNTGTWRPFHYETLDGKGFMGWRTQTYTVIRAAGEKMPGGETLRSAAFGAWTGAVKLHTAKEFAGEA